MFLQLYRALLAVFEVLNLALLLAKTILSPLLQYIVAPAPVKNVRNQIVLITGAGSGIGRELTRRFAENGSIVVAWDINSEALDQTMECLDYIDNLRVHPFVVDVSDERTVDEFAYQVKQRIGDPNIVINNAGIAPCEPFKKLASETIRKIFNVNVLAHMWVVKHFLPAMERNNRGHIVALSSSAGIMGSPYFTAYGASKHAVVGFMKCLSEEMDVNCNIKLTTICPLGISGTGIDIPTKTRFPFLLPVMELDYAVDAMFDAILREDEFVVLPLSFKWIHRIISIFPQKIASSIWKCLDYEIAPVGAYSPIGRAHYYDRVNRKISQISNGSTSNSNHAPFHPHQQLQQQFQRSHQY